MHIVLTGTKARLVKMAPDAALVNRGEADTGGKLLRRASPATPDAVSGEKIIRIVLNK